MTTNRSQGQQSLYHMLVASSNNLYTASLPEPSGASVVTKSVESPGVSSVRLRISTLEGINADSAAGTQRDGMNPGENLPPIQVPVSRNLYSTSLPESLGSSVVTKTVGSPGLRSPTTPTSTREGINADSAAGILGDKMNPGGHLPPTQVPFTRRRHKLQPSPFMPVAASSDVCDYGLRANRKYSKEDESRLNMSDNNDRIVDRGTEPLDRNGSGQRLGGRHLSEGFEEKKNASLAESQPGESSHTAHASSAIPVVVLRSNSSDREADSIQIQNPKQEPRQKTSRPLDRNGSGLGGRHLSEGFEEKKTEKNNAALAESHPGESSHAAHASGAIPEVVLRGNSTDCEADSTQIQNPKQEPRQKISRGLELPSTAAGRVPISQTTSVSPYGNHGAAEPEASLNLGIERYLNDVNRESSQFSALPNSGGQSNPVPHSAPMTGTNYDVNRESPQFSARPNSSEQSNAVPHSAPLTRTNYDVNWESPQYSALPNSAGESNAVPHSGLLMPHIAPLTGMNSSKRAVPHSGPLLPHSAPLTGRGQKLLNSKSLGSIRMTETIIRPPNDFVCPITGQLFNDPVTLETGQTYERKAIQEWLYRGNTTCPITRQVLKLSSLPRTNYLLKRLVDNWKEQHPELAREYGSSLLSKDGLDSKSSSDVVESSISSVSECSRLLQDGPTIKSDSEIMERSLSSGSDCSLLSNDDTTSICGSDIVEGDISPIPPMDSSQFRNPRSFNERIFVGDHVNDRSRPSDPVEVDGLFKDLKAALQNLCTSESLAECESLILKIARLVEDTHGDQKSVRVISRAGAIAPLIELFLNSKQAMVLNATLYILSILIDKDDSVRQAVVSADPEFGCLTGLLRSELTASVSVLYQLKLPVQQLASPDFVPLLVGVIKGTGQDNGAEDSNGEQDLYSLIIRPRSAAIILLDQIITSGDHMNFSQNSQALIELHAVPSLISSLDQAKCIDVQTSVIALLLCCIQVDGRSRNTIANTVNLAPVVDLLHCGNDRARTVAISFLNDLVHLNRRALCTNILNKLKAQGNLSCMRVLLVYLQMAPLKHRPVAASLLLQLDLLEEPCNRSVYREEAVESLVEALTSNDWPCPAEAANTLIALGGRFSYSGEPMMKAWLLKTAGVVKYFQSLIKDKQDQSEFLSPIDEAHEEKSAEEWETKVAGALVDHELGTLIEALGQGIQSKNPEVSKPCMIVATWLMHLLPKLPDTGVRQTARNCLFDHFVVALQTSSDNQQKVLAALAIQSFLSDPEGLKELLSYVKEISEPLRKLKKSTWTAREILQAFTTHADPNMPDLWVHAEQGQLDIEANGEVRALVLAGSRIFSGHSDGTIKIWNAKKKRVPLPQQEHKEHTKSVTALSVSLKTSRLYSASLDKSIRVWALKEDDIQCVHIFDLKDPLMGIVVDGPIACIIPQGVGVTVQYEETTTRLLNQKKYVQSLAISNGKVFCGCADNSVQELDPVSESVHVIQHGASSLLGKRPYYATQVFQDHLYVAGTPLDGVAGKVWRLSDRSLVGTICTTSEVRSMVVSDDFIYLGASSGVIEVWLRQRLLKVSQLNAGSKVISLLLNGDTLYSGSEDGKIRIWTMS